MVGEGRNSRQTRASLRRKYRRFGIAVNAGEFPIQDFYQLPLAHMMAKFIAVAFYFGELDRNAFRDKFGLELELAFPEP